jgi:hypothetical protein
MSNEGVKFVLGFADPLNGDGHWEQREVQHLHSSLLAATALSDTEVAAPHHREQASVADFAINVAPVATTAIMGFAGAWVQAKFGRKVRLKTGDIEVEAGSVEEVSILIDKLTLRENDGS